MNQNSILFLYEGETEGEFYKIFFESLPPRTIKITSSNLKGVYGLNDKVRSKISGHLQNKAHNDCNKIHVFVAYDREGDRTRKTQLDISSLEKEFMKIKKARIEKIQEIVATQDLESWLFHDLEGIYNFLQTPKSKRNMKLCPNVEAVNNYFLSNLFHKNNRHYQKGKKVEGFLKSLNFELIISKVLELQEAKSEIIRLL